MNTEVILRRFGQPDETADPHDSRVAGDEPYVSVRFIGDRYVR